MHLRDELKIFWPSHICTLHGAQNDVGYMIGWFNSPSTVCVAAVIENIAYQDLRDMLSNFYESDQSEFAHINRVCKSSPRVLGVVVREYKETSSLLHSNDQDPWFTVTLDNSYMPVPLSIHYQKEKHLLQYYEVIFYDQPNPKRLQFLSLDPLDLDISGQEPIDERLRDEKYRMGLRNLQKVTSYSHAVTGHKTFITKDLESILVQINSSFYLETGVQKLRTCYLNGNSAEASNVTACVKNAIKFFVRIIGPPIGLFGRYLRRVILGPCLCIMFILLSLAELTLHILNMRLPKFPLNAVAIKDLSTAGQQIDLRLQQLYFWPRQYTLLRRQNWANTAKARAYYISFHNSMWLVANDIIIGLAIGTFLSANRYIMSYLLHKVLHEYTVESLKSMMLWFLESPAGLKLNHELGSFLSELFLWLIRLWTECMQSIQPYTPQIIHIIGISGIFGVSMVISLFSDLLAFMTLHVYCFYMVAARIFNWQLIILYSLFNLFRGKKRNMLRNRIDACDYDLDQLLPGTCLFTLLTFLFPTVLVYYLTFALSRASVIVLQAVMETLLAFFNHFPLFAILLRFKDPDRLPGGLEFEIVETDYMIRKHRPFRYYWDKMRHTSSSEHYHHHRYQRRRQKSVHFKIPTNNKNKEKSVQLPIDNTHGAYLHMQNSPIPLGAICFQYMMLWKRLSAHYFSAYYFKCFLYGEPIKPIPKLQYPMLPESRPPLSTVWELLKSTLWDTTTKT